MEWSDYKVHKYILKTYSSNEQIIKTIDELNKLQLIFKGILEGNITDNTTLVNAIASIEVMLEEMKINFDINKNVDQEKSNIITNMAISVGLVDKDEIDDMSSKRSHKLKPEDVVIIRQAYANKEASETDLANKYNVTPSIISDVVTGVTYKNLDGPISPKKIIGKLTDDQVVEIREKYAKGGITQNELAKQYNVTYFIISGIISGKMHRNAPGPITKKGKGHNRIPTENIEPEVINQIQSDYYNGNYTFQALSEKYSYPMQLIRKLFREGRVKTTQPVKFSKIGNITPQIVQRYVQIKGVMPGEVETFLTLHYDTNANLEGNLSKIKDFALDRKWNAMTIRACRLILKRAYGEGDKTTE